jgi:hypothetical protein
VILPDYTPYQEGVIRRYYAQQPDILQRRLAELVSDLYLADGSKRQQLWLRAAEIMSKLAVPRSRIDHLLRKGDPALLAQVTKELEAKRPAR